MITRERIGLFGGSFDPIHTGHLILAQSAVDHACLDRVYFIPTSNPPHKKPLVMSPFDDRKKMVELAIAGNEKFFLSAIEEKEETSYTFDSILYFKELGYGREDMHLLIGADTLGEISGWKNPEVIFEHATIVVMQRPGYKIPGALPPEAAIMIITEGANTISSKSIRRSVSEEVSIRYLVPESVEKYINKRSLYRK